MRFTGPDLRDSHASSTTWTQVALHNPAAPAAPERGRRQVDTPDTCRTLHHSYDMSGPGDTNLLKRMLATQTSANAAHEKYTAENVRPNDKGQQCEGPVHHILNKILLILWRWVLQTTSVRFRFWKLIKTISKQRLTYCWHCSEGAVNGRRCYCSYCV